jgi:hypothetical protein
MILRHHVQSGPEGAHLPFTERQGAVKVEVVVVLSKKIFLHVFRDGYLFIQLKAVRKQVLQEFFSLVCLVYPHDHVTLLWRKALG